jgi:hypothetical protein
MSTHGLSESLHRLVKQALDSGAASSVAEAEAILHGYRLAFAIDTAESRDPLYQAALLTGVSLARRVFLGGVTVAGNLDVPLVVPLPLGANLHDAVVSLGGTPAAMLPEKTPIVNIGGVPRPRAADFHVRTVFSGWRGGILPVHSETALPPGTAMPLAPMLSAALAVNEAFIFVSDRIGVAGRRAVGLSLWAPSPEVDWLGAGAGESELHYLPSKLWLIGLGHLGQAYLWGLGLLPYPRISAGLELVLQDTDDVTPSSESTSVLADGTTIGQKKTRVMAAWAERRGFSTSICERLFDASVVRLSSEPAIALCGIDNALVRQALDQVGFGFVVEAGLGRGHRDFRSIRLHTLPGPRPAAELWKGGGTAESTHERAAYQRILQNGELDLCGVTLLAGKAVGAPFVGSVAACLVLSEVLRLLHGGPLHQVLELDLRSVEQRAIAPRLQELAPFNPGFVSIS